MIFRLFRRKPRSFGRKVLTRGLTLTALGVTGVYNFQAAEARDQASLRNYSLNRDSAVAQALNALPLRAMSRLWGWANSIDLPLWARSPVYQAWTYVFGCHLDEMRDPLDSYPNLGAFFSRHLKDGARPIADDEMVSPADGVLTVCGKVEEDGYLEQIKGVSYPAAPFLGFERMPKGNFYYCVLYLAPGDYHRIHSPTDCSFFRLSHIAGQLFPVASWATKNVPNLFARNERVVLFGSWKHGLFSYVPVGAYNVGSIGISDSVRKTFDSKGEMVTNSPRRDLGMFPSYTSNPLPCKKGDELAGFHLGSTVVLVFEVPEKAEFEFAALPGRKLKVGQSLGNVRLPTSDAPIALSPAPAEIDAAAAEAASSATTFPHDVPSAPSSS